MFSINVLLFGDYPHLAKRCLSSIVAAVDPAYLAEIRIGLNASSPETRKYVLSLAQVSEIPFHVYEEVTGTNVLKYPMMRRMFYDPKRPMPSTVKNVMWFDDDSYIKDPRNFLANVHTEFEAHKERCPLMGSVYLPGFLWTPQEQFMIASQPWFTGRDLKAQPKFITGGWWVASLEFLASVDYPFRELWHNGGDTILGEVVRQQGKELHHYRDNVAINADAFGKESKAQRRGVTTRRPFILPPPYDYSHHDFEVNVVSNREV